MNKGKRKLAAILGVLLVLTLFGCSKKADFSKYDGYAYTLSSGQTKYQIETKDCLKLHCFFRSSDPEYYEVVYNLNPDDAVIDEDEVKVQKITVEGSGDDISSWFREFTLEFDDGQVKMEVERDESTLAGGTEDNLLTGEYVLVKK